MGAGDGLELLYGDGGGADDEGGGGVMPEAASTYTLPRKTPWRLFI